MPFKTIIAGLAIAAGLAVPATASAQDASHEACGANPSTQTMEAWLTELMTVKRYELADTLPAALADLDVVSDHIMGDYTTAYITGRQYWQRFKDSDQQSYDECVKQDADNAADEREQEVAAQRDYDKAVRDRQRAAKLRCKSVGGVRIWKNRPNVSCAMARQLAHLGSRTTSYKGWHRSFHESGYWSYRTEQRVDEYGEVHTYRVPVDHYMQADWRKGKAKVTFASGVCDSKDCVSR